MREPHQTWFQWWEAQCTTGMDSFHLTGGVQIFQGDALVCYQAADWTLFIFCHCCQLWFSPFTHQIMTYSITLGLLTKFFSIKLMIKVTYSACPVFEFFLWVARKFTPYASDACAHTGVSQCSTWYKTKEDKKLKIINQQSWWCIFKCMWGGGRRRRG